MSLPEFKLLRPRTLAEAVGHLNRHAPADSNGGGHASIHLRVVAGGTDLIPSMRQKLFEPQYVLDIRHLDELKGIRALTDGSVEIGALTPLSTVEHSEFLRQNYPVLTEAAATRTSAPSSGADGRSTCAVSMTPAPP